MKRHQIFLLHLCLILFFFLLFSTLNKSKTPASRRIVKLPTQTLSRETYKKIRDELVTLTLKKNPKVALTILAKQIKIDDTIARSCHALSHKIGQTAYEKYKDFGKAMEYQDEICNSGYLHGVIESRFTNASDIYVTMQTVCTYYTPHSFSGWECYHGVGHGLMYFTENLLPRSLSLCETYKNNDAKSACINGVFMENFNTDQKIHHSRFLKSYDPLYPCQKQKTANKNDCYFYAPTYYLSLHKSAYQNGFAWCKTAEKDFQPTCMAGIGSQIMKESINNPKFVESICMTADNNDQVFCIEGMISLYINHFGRLDKAQKLCRTLEEKNKPTCEQVISSKKSLF